MTLLSLPIASIKLVCQTEASSPRPLPIKTIFDAFAADEHWLGSGSVISKTSLTPWIILILPSVSRSRPLSRWTSKSGTSSPAFADGKCRSQSTFRSHSSIRGILSSGMSGRLKARVLMDYHIRTISHNANENSTQFVPLRNLQGPVDFFPWWKSPRSSTCHKHVVPTLYPQYWISCHAA